MAQKLTGSGMMLRTTMVSEQLSVVAVVTERSLRADGEPSGPSARPAQQGSLWPVCRSARATSSCTRRSCSCW